MDMFGGLWGGGEGCSRMRTAYLDSIVWDRSGWGIEGTDGIDGDMGHDHLHDVTCTHP